MTASPATQAEGQNLVRNAGFEGGWHWQGGDNYLGKIADEWVAWWQDDASGKSPTASDFWKNQRPEYGLIGLQYNVPSQIHSGSQSLQYGKRYASHTAGAYQQISGITSGVKLRFSAWGFVYGQDSDSSKTPGYVHMRVGIDPAGGTNVFSGNVIWGSEAHPVAVNSGSSWTQLTVEAEAQNSTVTVFLYSSPDWPMNDALTSQWDDTSLVVTTPAETPTNTAPPPLPTWTAGPPPATSTPRPDGSVAHKVQSGETLWAIAIQYSAGTNMTADQMLTQIKQLNNSPSVIHPGQELVIAVSQNPPPPSANPTAAAPAEGDAPQPTAPAAEGQPAAETQPQAVASSSSAICVVAYHDRNSNGAHEEDTEEMLPNAGFTLTSQNGSVVGSYTSDGVNEPYCFEQLIGGTYMVQLTRPAGYEVTTAEYWAIPLQQGTTVNVLFGNSRDPNSQAVTDDQPPAMDADGAKSNPLDIFQDPSSEESEEKSESKSLLAKAGEIAIGVSGLFVLLLAGAVGFAFIASRRRI